MKIRHLLPALLVAIMMAGTLHAAKPIGQVIMMEGFASAEDEAGTERKLTLKAPVYLNDTVSTKKSSRVQLMLDDDSVISQGENSEITLDTFVYNPKVKSDNEVNLTMKRGVFRVITGKITELNPNKFKVKTKMATIGIRGCELCFNIRAGGEDIYVIELPRGRSIIVERDANAPGIQTGQVNANQVLNILRPGVVVRVQNNQNMRRRNMSVAEARAMIRATTPPPPPFNQPMPGENNEPPVDPDGNPVPRVGPDGNPLPPERPNGNPLPPPDGTAGDPIVRTDADGNPLPPPPDGTGDDPLFLTDTDGNPLPPPPDGTSDPLLPPPDGTTSDPLLSGDPRSPDGTFSDPLSPDGTFTGDEHLLVNGDTTLNPDPIGGDPLTGTDPTLTLDDPTASPDVVSDTNQDQLNNDLTTDISTVATDPDGNPLLPDAPPADPNLAYNDPNFNNLDPNSFPPPPPPPPPPDDGSGTTTTTTTDPLPPPDNPPPPPPGPTFVPMGGGLDWSWGAWDNQGTIVGVAVNGNNLTPGDFTAIATGAMTYNLSGGGVSAAVVNDNGSHIFMTGSSTLNVQVGNNVTPLWAGSFNMANGPDFLNFSASGTILANGDVTGTKDSYSLNVGGTPFGPGSIMGQNINGQLVGPGIGPTPITGIKGNFFFDHGAGVTVNGIFGSDLF